MPSFYGWCDLCLKFYPVSVEECEKQVVEFAQIALSDDPEIQAQAGKQLCPACKRKSATAHKPHRRCRKACRSTEARGR